jgi:hypothetical protein
MGNSVRSHSRKEFNALVVDAPEPTGDDVPVLVDGRRLDTPEKVRAFVTEIQQPEPDLDGSCPTAL